MALFQNVTTVSDAIAPFRRVQQNLSAVLAHTKSVEDRADRNIAHAEAHLEEVKRIEGDARMSASAERAKAEKIMAALASVLGEDE